MRHRAYVVAKMTQHVAPRRNANATRSVLTC